MSEMRKLHDMTLPRMNVITALAVITMIAIFMPARSEAATADSRAITLPASITAGYRGWTFAIGPAGDMAVGSSVVDTDTVTAYRWTTSGWSQTKVTPGMSFYAEPYTGIWSWAFRHGTWYAIKSTSLAPWSCNPAPLRAERAPLFARFLKYNNPSTTLAVGFGINDETTIYRVCTNQFADATGVQQAPYGYWRDPDALIRHYPTMKYDLVWVKMNGQWTKAYMDEIWMGS